MCLCVFVWFAVQCGYALFVTFCVMLYVLVSVLWFACVDARGFEGLRVFCCGSLCESVWCVFVSCVCVLVCVVVC